MKIDKGKDKDKERQNGESIRKEATVTSSRENTIGQIKMFTGIVYGLAFLTWFLLLLLNKLATSSFPVVMTVVGAVFMYTPFVASVMTKKITKDKEAVFECARPRFKGNLKYYLMACFIPGILILVGNMIYFMILPGNLDWSMTYLRQGMEASGQSVSIPELTVPMIIGIGILVVVGGPLVLINHVFAFGEEMGWRGFLLPKLMEVTSPAKAILISGIIWGGWHFPLLLFGHNYGMNCVGYPILPIIVMMIFTVSIGMVISYLFIKTQSVIPCAIMHGTINAVGSIGLLIASADVNLLIGPSVSGILGCSGFMIVGIYLLSKLNNENKKEQKAKIAG